MVSLTVSYGWLKERADRKRCCWLTVPCETAGKIPGLCVPRVLILVKLWPDTLTLNLNHLYTVVVLLLDPPHSSQ